MTDLLRVRTDHAVVVTACLCIVDADGLPLLGTVQVRDVAVLTTRATARLAARPGPLTAADIDRLTRLLANELPAAA